MSLTPFENAEGLRIGSVEFVSPDEIKVGLDIETPDSMAMNAGTPRAFPRVNSYVLIPNDTGYLVGQVEWLTVERSAFPKRRGMQDFGLIDLPYPLRKMSLNPLGTLRRGKADRYKFQRGAEAFPTIGDGVFLPTDKQLRSIVESGDKRYIKIGTSPLAGNAEVRIDPDRLFGRHLAVLGNTGSGKSCSVAGLIRWSLEEAQVHAASRPNARFVVLDPNGEYTRAFTDPATKAKVFRVSPGEGEFQLQVPLWFWNSSEWCSFTQASAKAQRPVLQQALRMRRNAAPSGRSNTPSSSLVIYLQGVQSALTQEVANNAPFATAKDGKYWTFLELLKCISGSLAGLLAKTPALSEFITPVSDIVKDLVDNKCKNDRGYNKPFQYTDIDNLILVVKDQIEKLGGQKTNCLYINEDVPIPFSEDDFLIDLDFLATNSGNRQWFDFFLARIRTMLTDTRMSTIMGGDSKITLVEWLNSYIGSNKAENGCITIIDLSLVPSEVIHITTAVIARMTFEALQRYRKVNGVALPTVLVMEEAHTFIKRYSDDSENQDAASVCCQVFERIAREGRKFGLGLVLSSQRPSELSQTVLSQCNSFLLHRISNDRDQDLVHRFVPDNLKGLLRELPSLPSQNAILLGWASELPVMVKMNELPKQQQPHSDDPDFWDTWSGTTKIPRGIDWKEIATEWQEEKLTRKKCIHCDCFLTERESSFCDEKVEGGDYICKNCLSDYSDCPHCGCKTQNTDKCDACRS